VSREGVRNGQNIIVEKGRYIALGNWKEGKRHGNYLQITNDGICTFAYYKNDLKDGEVIHRKLDGTERS